MKKGDLVIVNKGGLLTTGMVGAILRVFDDKAEVKIEGRVRPLTYRLTSLKLRNIKAKPKKKLVDVVDVPVGRRCLVVHKDGKEVKSFVAAYVDSADGKAKFSAGTVDINNIIHLFPANQKVKFLEPKVNKFPFWVFGDSKEFLLNAYTTHAGGCFSTVCGYDLCAEWLDKDQNLRHIKQIEVPEDVDNGGVWEDYSDDFKELLDSHAKKALGIRMSYAVCYIDDLGKKQVYTNFGAACHYSMKTFAAAKPKKDKFNWLCGVQFLGNSYRNGDKETKERIQKYTEWVMNNSPWSRYIITKDFKEAVETGVKIRLDIPSNAMMCTFYALRYPTEYMDKIKVWENAVDNGLDPAMAFFYAETNKLAREGFGHHSLLDTRDMDKESLINFLKNGVGGVVEELWTKTYRYANVSMHHGKEDMTGETALRWLNEQDIYGKDVKEAGGMFNAKQVKDVDLVKLQELVLKLKG